MPRVSSIRSKFFWKTYTTFAALFLGTMLTVSWIISTQIEKELQDIEVDSLEAKAEYLFPYARDMMLSQAPVASEMMSDLGHQRDTRITFIKLGGEILFDSQHSAKGMENHWDRSEVREALEKPLGISKRLSKTMGREELYVAKAVKQANGDIIGVVRVSLPTDGLNSRLLAIQLSMATIVALGAILALGIGWSIARKVAIPIREMVQVAEAMREGHYDQKVRSLSDDELGRLGDTLNRLGSELTNKISELHRLETVRRDFVANVSHEIKTPLTSIKGYVETLLDGAIDDPEHRRRFLEKIERNSERLTNLVLDLLSLAKIEAVEDSLPLQPTDWTPIITSVVSRNEDTIQKKHLKVALNLPSTPILAVGEKEAMMQVLDNLLTNAVKYTPDGGKVSVTLTSEDGWVKLSVEDTGIGIPHEHLDRIFERFYRVDKARSRELGGTGLGLSIVKHLVTAMSGDIDVHSALGKGSCFTIMLPKST